MTTSTPPPINPSTLPRNIRDEVINRVTNMKSPEVIDLMARFDNRSTKSTTEIAEIIHSMMTTLKLDHDSGRPKHYSISGDNLGIILGIGKGTISQYLSVYNMLPEVKEYMKTRVITLTNAYMVSRMNDPDQATLIKRQKEAIDEKCSNVNRGDLYNRKRYHLLAKSVLIIKSIQTRNNLPLTPLPDVKSIEPRADTLNHSNDLNQVRTIANSIISSVNPELAYLERYEKEMELARIIQELQTPSFCGIHIPPEKIAPYIASLQQKISQIEQLNRHPDIISLRNLIDEITHTI